MPRYSIVAYGIFVIFMEFVSALRHLIDMLARDQVNPALAAGEIVTTGTLTRVLPVSASETWTTELTGIGLDGICVRFV
jgi:2-oxo-3-hexenedioate decarboxylase